MPTLREFRPFSIGDLVIVTGGNYTITTPGSYGVVISILGSHRPHAAEVRFTFFSSPGQSRAVAQENDYIISMPHLQLLSLFVEEHHISHIYSNADVRSNADVFHVWINTVYVSSGEWYPTATSFHGSMDYGSVSSETIQETIERLHKRQKFYNTYKDELSNWNT